MVFNQWDKNFGLALALAAVLVTPGWYLGFHPNVLSSSAALDLVGLFFVMTSLPGLIPAVIVSAFLSPYGIHGDEFLWLQYPISFVIYSKVFFSLLNRRVKLKHAKPARV